ncbi:MAG: ribosomal protein S5-alanine N-acetyltransferase [Aeromonas sp.]
MQRLPHLVTPHAELTVLPPERAELVLDYYLRNRDHLEPWEPLRPAGFYTLTYWNHRLRDSYQQCFNGSAINLAALDGSGNMIASCNFTNIIHGVFQACYLGYSIDQRYQGKGLMQELLTSAIDYMFTGQQLHRIMASYMPRNERSGRLLEKLGFEKEGLARDYLMINGRWEDHVMTALINPTSRQRK